VDTYEAIADPTRRRIIDLLAHESLNAGTIAEAFAVSRPAISRHLRVLRETGIVSVEEEAQQRFYHLNPERLSDVAAWIARYTTFWDEHLGRLAAHVETGDEQ
jgi:DNA-binding transcriptional ArsR family regulator